MSTPVVRIEAVDATHCELLEDLFERNDVHCFCRYWHYAGDSNAWLDRLFHDPETNRAEMRAALQQGSAEMQGLVALASGRAVGWSKVAPVQSLSKLYDQKLYRGLPCLQQARTDTYAVACLLVDEPWRRRGVARALIEAVGPMARGQGARWVEAFPRRAQGVADAQLWTGPAATFEKAGFVPVHDSGSYPVLRLELG